MPESIQRRRGLGARGFCSPEQPPQPPPSRVPSCPSLNFRYPPANSNKPMPAPSTRSASALSEINWDKFPQFSTRKRDRINHIDAALRSARKRGNVTLPNAKKFALELKVVQNTIYSTIRDMQDTLTLPVEFDAVRNGYFYAEDVVATPFSRFSEKEMLAVYLSAQMMSTFHKLPLRKHVRSAFRKLID